MGSLTCKVAGGMGFIFGSSKDLDCIFARTDGVGEKYTGAIKRYWGAYGNKPDDARLPPYDPSAPLVQQFRNPVHCAEPTTDGLVYFLVCLEHYPFL